LRYDRLLVEISLPRATGAAEDYLLTEATARLKPGLLEPIAPDPTEPMTIRLRSAAKRFNVLLEVWRDDLGCDLESLNTWSEFSDWRQLRHVLVHRLGHWQPGLDPQPRLEVRISNLGERPDLYRGRVPLATSDLLSAITNAVEVVLEIDGRA